MRIKESMDLAGQNLLAVLDPDHDFAPTGGWLVTHDTGRWWDAMLRLEEATGFAIPADLEGAMLRNLSRFSDNPDGLLLVPPDLGWSPPKFDLHSLRESLLAFNALVRYRHSHWAAGKGHHMIETLLRALRPDGAWDESAFAYAQAVGTAQAGSGMGDLTGSSGRLIEALVWFFQSTNDSLALELAARLAAYHLEHSTTVDGSLPTAIASPPNIGHSHSYLGTLRGLLLFGLLTHQHTYVERVAATYKAGVPHIVKESGWAAHDLGQGRFFDRQGNPVPETATPGDAAQIALWLALDAGHTELLDDVQRIVVSRLLPAQITAADAGAMHPVTPRELGAYGGVHALPHGGKTSTIDVTAAVLHTLADVYRHIAVPAPEGIWINFALDYEDERVRIEVKKGQDAVVTITLKVRENVLLRIPGWAPAETVRLVANGHPCAARIGSYVLVPKAEAPGVIRLSYALPVRRTVEKTANGGEYHFTWRGDEIISVSPNDADRPFYSTSM